MGLRMQQQPEAYRQAALGSSSDRDQERQQQDQGERERKRARREPPEPQPEPQPPQRLAPARHGIVLNDDAYPSESRLYVDTTSQMLEVPAPLMPRQGQTVEYIRDHLAPAFLFWAALATMFPN
jgi:hypothetical protein